jgi:hypothetical protein
MPAFAMATAGGPSISLTIEQHFGPSSVRSREDIAEIGRETAQDIRLTLGSLPSTSPRVTGG